MKIGTFLKEKLLNLAVWVNEEVGKENIPIDIEQFARDRTEVEVTFLAEVLNSNSAKISHRDWCGLVGLLNDKAISAEIASSLTIVIQLVRAREDMHDKFWRYMDLFKSVVNSNA